MESDKGEGSMNSSSLQVHSPDLFSDDDDDDAYFEGKTFETSNEIKATSKSEVSHYSHQEQEILNLESARLHRLLERLQGVPPPPSKTIPQIGVGDILNLWHKFFDKNRRDAIDDKTKGCSFGSLWKPTVSLSEATDAEWPVVKYMVFPDLHYNVCAASEHVEQLSMKLHDRYIGAETSSWCNPLTSLTSSAKKRQRNRGLGHTSPGCRLSHLARRRHTFSSANLAQLSSVAGSGTAGGAPPIASSGPSAASRALTNGSRRRIMVEIKKTDRNKRIKNNSKSIHTEAGALSSSLPLVNNTQEKPPVQSTKRALFQSPDEQIAAPKIQDPKIKEQNPAQRSKRALWPSDSCVNINENGKRYSDVSSTKNAQQYKLHCSDDRSHYCRTSRSLPFALKQSSSGNTEGCSEQTDMLVNKPSCRASEQGPPFDTNSLSGLSELHKCKLLWAITLALRKEGTSTKNSDFWPCANTLAVHYLRVRREMKNVVPASTSEHMLQVVSAKAQEVVEMHRTSKMQQEEKFNRKEERSNKGLFRDATASLNVRRSVSVPLLSTDHMSLGTKPQHIKRVPSARKSLTFGSVESKAGVTHDSMENVEHRFINTDAGDEKCKHDGENVALLSVKKVSRSLFLSPLDDSKTQENKRDSEKQGIEDWKSNVPSAMSQNNVKLVSEHSSREFSSGSNSTKTSYGHTEERDLKSVPTLSISSTTTANKADNYTPATDKTFSAKQENLVASHLTESSNSISLNHLSSDLSSAKASLNYVSGSIEEFDNRNVGQTQHLLGTQQREAHLSQAQPIRELTKKSGSLSRGELRSTCTESEELIGSNESQSVCYSKEGCDVEKPESCGLLINSVETIPQTSFCLKEDCMAGLQKGEVDVGSCTSSKDAALTESSESNSVVKVGSCANEERSLSLDGSTTLNSKKSGFKDTDTALESKVITPLLEGAAFDSPVCMGDESCSVDMNLTFQGRIESLKPQAHDDISTGIDPDLSFSVSSHILEADGTQKKSSALEKWAERASRSTQEVRAHNLRDGKNLTATTSEQSSETIEESMLPWEESQLDATSNFPRLFEQFKGIFDCSSQHGNS